jgi:hypothetical protein
VTNYVVNVRKLKIQIIIKGVMQMAETIIKAIFIAIIVLFFFATLSGIDNHRRDK